MGAFKKEIDKKLSFVILASAFLIGLLFILSLSYDVLTIPCDFPFISLPDIFPFGPKPEEPEEPEEIGLEGIKKFSSEEDFKDYLQKAPGEADYFGFGGFGDVGSRALEAGEMLLEEGRGGGLEPERFSETTVQVLGIDEPDIVKTNGQEIFFSRSSYWRLEVPIEWLSELVPPYEKTDIKIIKAFPADELSEKGEIDKTGDLLLKDNVLVVFSGSKNVYGYDVSDPNSPAEKWDIKLKDNNFLVTARLYQEKIYFITQTRINQIRPCPIKPLTADGESIEIKCGDIYHPISPVPADATFTVFILNPDSGEIEEKVSFVGSSSSSVVYMSENSIYITYSYQEDVIKFMADFLKEECQDLTPAWLIEKVEELGGYDISQQSKLLEFSMILEEYLVSLDNDERLRVENELANRMADYYQLHKRELEKTGLVKIARENLEMESSGKIPGYPLNQFSLDEYQGNLRIATTVGERWGWRFASGMGGESVNDVYILNEELQVQGSVQDLGRGERIYSVRFVEDKGYVVTFRQIDPFYVLDLSDPRKPELKGELKIPGYSSYLHPITKDKILGIGEEDWQVKVSLFDVSSPEAPKELDKYILDEYWSDVLSNHHAFLLDRKHKIFFLPGGKGGYVFSYENDSLALTKAVSETSVKRAIYIDDYLYIIGNERIIVLDEINWEKVNELEF